jgi:hypothetical protein
MEQELMDFDKWIEIQQNNVIEYHAVYNANGEVTSIGPSTSVQHHATTIKIDDDIALAIFDGRENLFSYRVDLITKTLIRLNNFATHTLTKIDDVLHRVVDRKWSKISSPDILICHDTKTSKLTFSMDNKYKKNIWEGDTEMNFLITDYNDPNILLQLITFKVGDIASSDKIFSVDSSTQFSVYTRRLFDQYVIDTL